MKPILTAILCAASLISASAADKPNVVILFSDDAGYADFGFQPSCAAEMKALTPNIDTIARDGARFTNAYMSGSVCSPSRAGLMTGRYQERFGFDNNLHPGVNNTGLDLKETFGVKRLQGMGYETGLIGKWHLGYPAEYHPNQRGFDHFHGLLQGSRPYFPMEKPSPHRVLQKNGEPLPEEGYVTDRLGDAACDFINGNKEKPFYLFVSFTSPHDPLEPKKEDADRTAHIKESRRKKYAGLVVSLDDNVGKILKCLEENGLDKNTIVLFTNDNGGQTQTGAVNTPLKGRKGQLAEGGIRVPWSVRWPGKIKPGSVIEDPVISLDILPTVVEAIGESVDPAWKLDGTSFLGLMTGGADALPERPLFWRQHGSTGERAIRIGNWKLHHDREAGKEPALYDLEKDISEASDIASDHPEVVKSMLATLDEWESHMVEPRWDPKHKK